MILEVISRILTPACPTEFWKAGPVVRDPEKRDRQRREDAKNSPNVQYLGGFATWRDSYLSFLRWVAKDAYMKIMNMCPKTNTARPLCTDGPQKSENKTYFIYISFFTALNVPEPSSYRASIR